MNKLTIKQYILKFQSIIALLVMCIAMSFLSDRFLTVENTWNVMRQISVNLIISVGMTLVILTKGIDLSVGSVLAIAGAVTASIVKFGAEIPSMNVYLQFTLVGAIAGGILAGVLLGGFNGLMITRFKVPPFVATLAMLTIARGMTMLWTGGFPITGMTKEMAFIGTGWFLGIPMPVWISAVVVLIAVLVTKRTQLGRHIYAVGGNETAARLSGLKIERIKLIVYSVAGAMAAIAGILVTSRLDSAQPNAGAGYELDSIAAVVIGGTSLSGGKGSVMGTVQGALIIGVLNNGLVLLNVSPFWQQIIKGLVILIAVGIEKINSKEE
ncbi:MAG: ribose ABC transporter permease [Paludibacter sp.]|jgi:ribose transport system permease protein|nr:ribose ABC transporter permease [Paludibacter sp.]